MDFKLCDTSNLQAVNVPLMLSSALLQPFEQNSTSFYKMEKLSIFHKELQSRKGNLTCCKSELLQH